MAFPKLQSVRGPVFLLIITLLMAGALFLYFSKETLRDTGPRDNSGQGAPAAGAINGREVVTGRINSSSAMDLHPSEPSPSRQDQNREKRVLEESFDMIVSSDEQFTIGDVTLSMRNIIEKSFLKKRKIFEEGIDDAGQTRQETIQRYGIYIVKPGDNLWNIHFAIVQEYFRSKGITLSRTADEPVDNHASSGLGKVLKFSEQLVTIYNIMEKTVDKNIDLLEPLSKIVVYNINEVFALLKKIDYKNMDKIRFDGETIWMEQHSAQ
ncbi:MAG: hypothetical protein R6V54_13745 [Desulfobacteraceae bacterium]